PPPSLTLFPYTTLFRSPSPYPYWIVVQGDGLSSSSPISSKLGAISLPWASSIDIDTTRKDSSKVEVLARSTKGSWAESNNFFLRSEEHTSELQSRSDLV